MVLKLVLAGLFGGIVGYEREVHEHPAGLRTHILVCLGSTLITMVSVSFGPPHSDPSRIAAQIVSGIGFLGAGTILRQGSIVRGLTTAASLWTVSGIGIAVGVGGPNGIFYVLAAAATLIVFLTLSIMRGFEPGLGKRAPKYIRLDLSGDTGAVLGKVLQQLMSLGVDVQAVHGAESHADGRQSYRLRVALPRRVRPDMIVAMLANQSGVERFDWS